MNTTKSSFEQHLDKLKTEYSEQLPSKLAAIASDWNLLCEQWQPDINTLLHRNIHSLIGTSGTFGFLDLSKAARELETILKPLTAITDNNFLPDAQLRKQFDRSYKKLLEHANPSSKGAEYNIEEEIVNISATVIDKPLITAPVFSSEIRQSGIIAQDILIYYLDDEIEAPELLIQSLISYGFKAKHFRTMAQLLEAIRTKKPNLAILDLMMPDITNESVFSLASSIVSMDIRVIILSSQSDFNSRLAAVRSGIIAYVVKPADVPSLVTLIRSTLRLDSDKPPHILIVDDQESVAEFYGTVLEHTGMKVTREINPLAVLDVMEANTPDLLLIDLNMPIVNGDELAAVIRQFEEYHSIPILFLSAEAHPEIKTRLLEIGSDDLLSKGMNTEEFVRQIRSRVERSKILTSMMYQDSLTGLLNHAQIQLAAERVFLHCRRKELHFCIAMIDIDKFKKVNDTYGHLTGDRVIKAIAQLFQQRLRITDYIGRFGGEEFMLVLPDININDAGNLINNLRKSFAAIEFRENGIAFNVSFSAGIAASTGMNNFIEQIKIADEALYRAKERGRNIVCASFSGEE